MEQKEKTQIKRRNVILTLVLFFFVCTGIILVLFKMNQKKGHDTLPVISHVDNYREYSPQELKDIVDKSDFSEVGAYLNLLSDKDRKGFIQRCKDFTKKDELTTYVFADDGTVRATKNQSIYEKAMEDYKLEVESLTPLGKRYLQMEKQKKQDEEEHVEKAISAYAAKDIRDLGSNPIKKYGTYAKYKKAKKEADGYDSNQSLLSKSGYFYFGIGTLAEYTKTMSGHKEIYDLSELGSKKNNSASKEEEKYSYVVKKALSKYVPKDDTYMKFSFTVNSIETYDNADFKIETLTVSKEQHGFNLKKCHKGGLRSTTLNAEGKGNVTKDRSILYFSFSYRVSKNKIPYSNMMFDYSGLGRYQTTVYPKINGDKFDYAHSVDVDDTAFKVGGKAFRADLATWGFENDQPKLYESFSAKTNADKKGVTFSFDDGKDTEATDSVYLQINIDANSTVGIKRYYVLEYYANAYMYGSSKSEILKDNIMDKDFGPGTDEKNDKKNKYGDGYGWGKEDTEAVQRWIETKMVAYDKSGNWKTAFDFDAARKYILLMDTYEKLNLNFAGKVWIRDSAIVAENANKKEEEKQNEYTDTKKMKLGTSLSIVNENQAKKRGQYKTSAGELTTAYQTGTSLTKWSIYVE